MVEFRRTKMFLLMMLLLQFTAVTGQDSFFVRDGDEAALPCKNARHDQDKCGSTYWTFSHSIDSAVDLIVQGQIGKDAQTKSDRLSLTENCSLVLKNVSREDVGLYGCRQINPSGEREAPDALVYLSVVTITEQKDGDEVKFTCSVSMYGDCSHSVKWLYQGRDVDKGHSKLLTSQSLCSVSVSFQTSHFIYGSRYKIFSCNVTDGFNKQQLTFPIQASPEESGEDETIATKTSMKAGDWRFIIVSVGLAALIIIFVAVNIWSRNKGKQTQADENTVPDDEDDGRETYENVGSSDV